LFGIIRPCRHRLSQKLQTEWMAHLCGMCLALRDDHGQAARVATNYDGLIISVLVEAQSERPKADGRRKAGPCPLRAMRRAEVAMGEGARLAGAVSLVLASAKMRDHVDDGDGVYKRRAVAGGARKVAARWARQGAGTALDVGFDTAVMVDAVDRQVEVEALAGPGVSVLTVTEPTETATAAAFAHTAVLAGRPENAEALAEAGRLFGRLAHLLDAVEDIHADRAAGAWNPLLATGTGPEEAHRLCRDAATGIRLALGEVAFDNGVLTHRLLVHEVDEAIDRSFRHAGFPVESSSCSTGRGSAGTSSAGTRRNASGTHDKHGSHERSCATRGERRLAAPEGSWPHQQPPGAPHDPNSPWGPPGGPTPPPPPPGGHNVFVACAIWVGLCCTCQWCCRESFEDPCTGQQRQGCCHKCDCCDACEGCGECCECCQCCACDC
jgi:uncharacterized protein DUF5685